MCKWIVNNLAAFTTRNRNSLILGQRMKSKAAMDVITNRKFRMPSLGYESKSFSCYSAQFTMYITKPMPYHGSGDLDANFLQIPQVQLHLTSMQTCCGQSATEAGFFPSSFSFSLLIITKSLLCTRTSPLSKICNSPNQITHYHTLSH